MAWEPTDKKLYADDLKQHYTDAQLAKRHGGTVDTVGKYHRRLKEQGLMPERNYREVHEPTIDDVVKTDVEDNRYKHAAILSNQKYQQALAHVQRLEAERDAAIQMVDCPAQIHVIANDGPDEVTDATAFAIASDWHVEELVDGSTVNYMNEYNLEIAEKRADDFARGVVDNLLLYQSKYKIKTLVLGLLGDFISGSIHEELMESNQLQPVDAVIFAQNLVASVIQHILDNTQLEEIVCICKSGNHGRNTKKQRHATEAGNSLEYFMYHTLRNSFKDNKRVRFVIERGYHTYLTVYDHTIRFHHGHGMQYQGGIGGIFIPVNKAIAQWNKTRIATYDVFGHFHTFLDGGNFICNGSQIGYNAYGLSVKASYDTPKQAFFIFDRAHGKTEVTPITYSV